jgi:hypothetical protein
VFTLNFQPHILAVLGVHEDHHQNGDINFHGNLQQYDLGLNEQPADDGDDMHHYLEEEAYAHPINLNVPACQGHEAIHQQQEMQQMISKPDINNYLHLLFQQYICLT